MVVNIHPITGDGALGEQAFCLLFSLKQAGCLLSQCLERLKKIGPNGLFTRAVSGKNKGKTEAGPVVKTRRVVAPEPGLVCHEPGEFEESVAAEGCLHG